MTEQQAEETTTVYARVNWTNHYTETTVNSGDPVQVNVADVDRLVRYGLVTREGRAVEAPPQEQSAQVEEVHQDAQETQDSESKPEHPTAHHRRTRKD